METLETASHSGKESRTNLDQFQQEWLQRLGAVEARIACMETLAGNVAAEVEAAALEVEAAATARLKQSFGETIRQACEGMKRYAVACKESRLIELEAELERKMEPFLSRSQMTINDLEQLLESIIRQRQNIHAHTSQATAHDYSQV
jgi:hypothetical protein